VSMMSMSALLTLMCLAHGHTKTAPVLCTACIRSTWSTAECAEPGAAGTFRAWNLPELVAAGAMAAPPRDLRIAPLPGAAARELCQHRLLHVPSHHKLVLALCKQREAAVNCKLAKPPACWLLSSMVQASVNQPRA
jgi:hypothetical protein